MQAYTPRRRGTRSGLARISAPPPAQQGPQGGQAPAAPPRHFWAMARGWFARQLPAPFWVAESEGQVLILSLLTTAGGALAALGPGWTLLGSFPSLANAERFANHYLNTQTKELRHHGQR